MTNIELLEAQKEMKARLQSRTNLRNAALTANQAELWREQHYTIQQLSDMWTFDPETIRRRIKDDPEIMASVAKVGEGETRNKRSYFNYAVPQSVAARLHAQLCKAR